MRGKEKEKRGGRWGSRGGGEEEGEGGGRQREREEQGREDMVKIGKEKAGGWGRRGREEVNSSATRKCYSYHNSLLSATLISIQFYRVCMYLGSM